MPWTTLINQTRPTAQFKSCGKELTEKGGVKTKLCSSASLCRDNLVLRNRALMSRVSCWAPTLSATHRMLLQISQPNSKQRTVLPHSSIEKLQSHRCSPGNPPASPPRSAKTGVVGKSKGGKTLLIYLQKKQ